jgi:tetrahydromethanopterin S-methyltransferase subunit G
MSKTILTGEVVEQTAVQQLGTWIGENRVLTGVIVALTIVVVYIVVKEFKKRRPFSKKRYR